MSQIRSCNKNHTQSHPLRDSWLFSLSGRGPVGWEESGWDYLVVTDLHLQVQGDAHLSPGGIRT